MHGMPVKKSGSPSGLPHHLFVSFKLGKADCLVGAYISTCATLCAHFGVDAIDVTLGDSSYGTFVNTSSTCDTIFANYVSHNVKY